MFGQIVGLRTKANASESLVTAFSYVLVIDADESGRVIQLARYNAYQR
jgi:hypothetical protein